jgi:hypothetical protein
MDGRNSIVDDLSRFIGQTVTIFTTSGGESGSGFTGVLIDIDCDNVKILNHVGAAPDCPLGSNCCRGRGFGNVGGNNNWGFNNWGGNNNWGNGNFINPLGAVTIIPIRTIAAFTHNAI